MKAIIQKTSGFLFIALSITPLLLVIFFSVKEQVIQVQMKKKLESNELQTVMIPAEKVIWMDDHEIWVNESMFDIRTQKLENGVYTFTGMYDADETALVLQQKKTSKTQSDQQKQLVQTFNCLKNIFNDSGELLIHPPVVVITHHSFISLRLPEFSLPIPTPPPQLASVLIEPQL